MQLKYDAVVFDLFGTLVDYLTTEEYRHAQAQVAAMFAVPVDDFQSSWIDSMKYRDKGLLGGLEGDLPHVLRELGCDPTAEQIREAAQVRLKFYRRNLEPRRGAVETLNALTEAGYKIGLITDCASEVPLLWDDTVFPPLLDAVVFSCAVGTTKPDPQIYHMACDQLGVEPSRCLYVGDGGSRELTGARALGMDAVLIRVADDPYPGTGRLDAREWTGAVISSLPEVLALL